VSELFECTHESPAIRQAYAELVSVIQWIDENGKVLDIVDAHRPKMAAACLDMVLEHQAAIAVLIGKRLHGSAFALLRGAIEALIRGMWIARYASVDQLQQFQRDEGLPGIKTLIRNVELALGKDNAVLSVMHANQWDILCSFTHTGFRQVTRRYTGYVLSPNYPESEIVQALRFTGAVGLLAMTELATYSNNWTLARATLDRSRMAATSANA
jgi:hypothetical protein